MFIIRLQDDEESFHTSPVGVNQLINICCFRFKVLAQQYKAMYPTLEIDTEGELVKLQVTEIKQKKNTSESFKFSSLHKHFDVA